TADDDENPSSHAGRHHIDRATARLVPGQTGMPVARPYSPGTGATRRLPSVPKERARGSVPQPPASRDGRLHHNNEAYPCDGPNPNNPSTPSATPASPSSAPPAISTASSTRSRAPASSSSAKPPTAPTSSTPSARSFTERLIAEKGFNAVAVEADWSDAY